MGIQINIPWMSQPHSLRRNFDAELGYLAKNGNKNVLKLIIFCVLFSASVVVIFVVLHCYFYVEKDVSGGSTTTTVEKVFHAANGRSKKCSSCRPIEVNGGHDFVRFVPMISPESGCKILTVKCGNDYGTEALMQWHNHGKSVSVSFMDAPGQSSVIRTLRCNDEGEYELDDDGVVVNVTSIDCVVAMIREDL